MELYSLAVGGLQTNCYIVASDQNNAVLVDPGDDFDKILKSIKEYNLTPKMILLTHGHFDHIGAVNKLKEHFGIKAYGNMADEELFTDVKRNRARYFRVDQRDYNVKIDVPLEDGQVIKLDELEFKIITTPGHTRGGVCIICQDTMFTGDTLFPLEIGRCDMYGGDLTVMYQTLKKLYAIQQDYMVLPGHGPFTRLQHEKQHNPYMQEIAAL